MPNVMEILQIIYDMKQVDKSQQYAFNLCIGAKEVYQGKREWSRETDGTSVLLTITVARQKQNVELFTKMNSPKKIDLIISVLVIQVSWDTVALLYTERL